MRRPLSLAEKGNVMLIKAKRQMAGSYGLLKTGQVADVPDHIGRELVGAGRAEIHDPAAELERQTAEAEAKALAEEQARAEELARQEAEAAAKKGKS